MKKRYVVQCPKHGHDSKDWAGRQLVVPPPTSKKNRYEFGCPFCKAEQEKEVK